MRRTTMFLKAFFIGVVDDIPQVVLRGMEEKWNGLKHKDEFLQDIKQQSASKRESMFETATRSNYLIVVAAFVIAANVAMLVAPDGSAASQVLLKISTSLIALAAAIMTIAISAKSKVMKKPCEGGEIEPEALLRRAFSIESEAAVAPNVDVKQWKELVSASHKLQKRKIILVVERRAQWISAVFMSIGLIVMIIGICLR